MTVIELSRRDARRLAVRAQLLGATRPAGLLELVRGLTMIQSDSTSAVAPSAELVAWSRLGTSVSQDELSEALAKRTLVELHGMIRPAEDVALYRADMHAWPGTGEVPGWRQAQARWVQANDAFRRAILARLEDEGPLTSREFPDACAVSWKSSGWNNNRNAAMMIEFLVSRGEVAAAGRRGRDRLWDLASRVYPDEAAVPVDEARRIRNERRLRALGIARAKGPACPVEPNDVGEVGMPAVVEGVRGEWRVDAELLDQRFRGRAALLSPLDRLVYDRKRTTELFEFDYQLEMYKPATKRRWGYWALPILFDDRFVGKVDATTDAQAGMLRVDAIHEDEPFTPEITSAVNREIKSLARWLGLGLASRSGVRSC